ncbi:MAG TPA: hypothetical protein VFO19_11595 [Vicinamibacterales bacterium]|nr:hypothetical protein [Vicinamibacterales bacterium]
MARRTRVPAVLVFAALLVGGCGQSPTRPTTMPAGAGLVSIRLEGPSRIAPDQTADYRVIATLSDGASDDVTASAVLQQTWARGGTVRIDGPGRVTGVAEGALDLTASYPAPGGSAATLRVLVLEAGTYEVSGVVTESGRPFPGVPVSVLSGRHTGLKASTDYEGRYYLYGLAGPTELQVIQEGLRPVTHALLVSTDANVDFGLEPLPGYDSLAGTWRLTLEAESTCASVLPAETMFRTLSVAIAQRGSQLSVALDSTGRVVFDDYPQAGIGGVAGDHVDMYFQRDPDAERFPPRWVLMERLSPTRFLGISGPLSGTRTGSTVSGTLSGYFSVYRSVGPDYLAAGTALETECLRKIGQHATLHSFRLDRD